jgi:succinate dehydrogenase/fumarate reductase-like Fe-S protein
MQEFKVPLTSDTTILDALHTIKAEPTAVLLFGVRAVTRSAARAMNVNGRNMLVCKTPLTREMDKRPRDRQAAVLSADHQRPGGRSQQAFWEQYQRAKRG